jgi:hypothetical protein
MFLAYKPASPPLAASARPSWIGIGKDLVSLRKGWDAMLYAGLVFTQAFELNEARPATDGAENAKPPCWAAISDNGPPNPTDLSLQHTV